MKEFNAKDISNELINLLQTAINAYIDNPNEDTRAKVDRSMNDLLQLIVVVRHRSIK